MVINCYLMWSTLIIPCDDDVYSISCGEALFISCGVNLVLSCGELYLTKWCVISGGELYLSHVMLYANFRFCSKYLFR